MTVHNIKDGNVQSTKHRKKSREAAHADLKSRASQLFQDLQRMICVALEEVDGSGQFVSDVWERSDLNGGAGGGGDTRVLKEGAVFEQAGVNFSDVNGTLPADMAEKLTGIAAEAEFYACGVSLVIHPRSPMVPTCHANFRYLEVGTFAWFGGGSDLTPYYLEEEDAIHFHSMFKRACDLHDPEYYPKFKRWCDEYFYLPHRGEARGVGGIFFDYIGKENPNILEDTYSFVADCGAAFLQAYLPIVERRKNSPWTEEQKRFQLLRRGRYVEFNLLHDRGTLFGLRTGGRIESILMSLPPEVRWEYGHTVPGDSREAELLAVLRAPRAWAAEEIDE